MSYNSREGGYLGNIYEPYELIEALGLSVDDQCLYQDMVDSIADLAWASQRDYYEENDAFRYNWEYFKSIVKNEARYFFYDRKFQDGFRGSNPYSILNIVSEGIKELKLVDTLPSYSTLFRCRQHKEKEILTKAHELTSPPKEYALYSNRMSPGGISMFYGAFDLDTAQKEVVDISDTTKEYLTSGIFKNKESLYIIDFTKIPTMNIFNKQLLKDYDIITFLQDFIEDISRPIKHDGKEHIEYVPTQILTEFFRYIHPHHKTIDGIIYRSSKNAKGKVIVLFMDHDKSLQYLDFQENSLKRSKIDPLKYPNPD